MPVGTQGSVKTLTPAEVDATGARIVLGNTYHLWLRPGAELIADHGGLHDFCRWPHAMLTDSGGFQAFSLAKLCQEQEDGFAFRSHLDGARLRLTPEEAMRVQGILGADIAMQLDVCPPGGSSADVLRQAMDRTTRWAVRCLAAKRPEQALFAIVQGGTNIALRHEHAEALGELSVDGLALGGFSVGEPVAEMHAAVDQCAGFLDAQRPRYLMGVGTPRDLIHAIAAGIDMFDCVLPTRNARNGQGILRSGRVVIKQARYKYDQAPLDASCGCPCCREGFSRAYLRHLYMARELLVLRLFSQHNLWVFGQLMREARAAIVNEAWAAFTERWAAAGRDHDGP